MIIDQSVVIVFLFCAGLSVMGKEGKREKKREGKGRERGKGKKNHSNILKSQPSQNLTGY